MPQEKKRVAVLWNEGAGWDAGDEDAQKVQAILGERDGDVGFRRVKPGENLIETSRDLIRSGSRVIVAAGGDGTVNAVASALVHSPASLAVIPAGTLNHFARDLAIPLDPEGAARSILNGREIIVDVGSVNGRVFINNSVLGVYPKYRAARLAYERRGLGVSRIGQLFAVVRAIVRVFWRLPHMKLFVTTENGEVHSVRTPFVLVANNEHEVENWNIGHRRSIDEGRLWMYVMRRSTRWAAFRFLLAFLFKRFSRDEAFDVYCAEKLQVSAQSAFIRVGVDGEVIRMKSPLTYESIPKALKVIAPSHYLASGTA